MNSAVLGLAAHAVGVALPDDEFTTTESTLSAQLKNYTSSQIKGEDYLCMHVGVRVEQDRLTLHVESGDFINTFAVGPVVDRLNAFSEGLGWFVFDTLHTRSSTVPIYQIPDIADFVEMMWFDPSLTDDQVVQVAKDEWGEEELTPDGFFERSGGYRPSDLLKMVDGHRWMIRPAAFSDKKRTWIRSKRPKSMSAAAAKKLLRSEVPDDIRNVVKEALDLSAALASKACEIKPMPPGGESEGDSEPRGSYGASCVLVWDQPDLAWEVLEHYETSEMEGDGDNTHLVLYADPSNETEVRTLVKSFQAIVRRHAAFNNLLKHFPLRNGA